MKLTPEELKRIAHLARITVSESDVAALQTQLNGIFGLIDELQAVDTKDIEPLSHPLDVISNLAQRLREDRVTENDKRHANTVYVPDGESVFFQEEATDDWWTDVAANAPAVEHGLFLVPKVLD